MKITDHIKKAEGKTLFSFEIIPPKKGNSIEELYKNIDPLMEFKPPFIDVTTSREEYVYVEKNGLLDRKVTRMRPGTVGICAAIKHKYDVDTIPHNCTAMTTSWHGQRSRITRSRPCHCCYRSTLRHSLTRSLSKHSPKSSMCKSLNTFSTEPPPNTNSLL